MAASADWLKKEEEDAESDAFLGKLRVSVMARNATFTGGVGERCGVGEEEGGKVRRKIWRW